MKSSHFQNNTQTFNDFAKDNELPIDNFEQWARLVKDQMLKSLHSRSRKLLNDHPNWRKFKY